VLSYKSTKALRSARLNNNLGLTVVVALTTDVDGSIFSISVLLSIHM